MIIRTQLLEVSEIWKAQNQKNFGKFKYCTSLNEKPRSEPRSLTRQSTSNSIHLATHTLRTRPFEALWGPLTQNTQSVCYYSLASVKKKMWWPKLVGKLLFLLHGNKQRVTFMHIRFWFCQHFSCLVERMLDFQQ